MDIFENLQKHGENQTKHTEIYETFWQLKGCHKKCSVQKANKTYPWVTAQLPNLKNFKNFTKKIMLMTLYSKWNDFRQDVTLGKSSGNALLCKITYGINFELGELI